MDMVNISTNDPDITKYIIKFLRGNTMIVTKDFFKSTPVPDIVSKLIYLEDYKN